MVDTDLRELIGEDDLFFDPFEDEIPDDEVPMATDSFEEDVDVPVVGAPMEERPAKVDTRPARVRMDEMFEKMRAHKRLFLKLIDYCREPKTGEQMNARTEELTRDMYSVYSPVIMRELLEDAGAIEYLKSEEELAAEAALEQGETATAEGEVEAVQEIESPTETDVDSLQVSSVFAKPVLQADVVSKTDDVLVPVQDASSTPLVAASLSSATLSSETFLLGDEEVDVEFLEIDEVEPGMWVATAEGLAYVDEQDDMKASRELLAEEPRYLDIYHQILDFCSDPRGRSVKEVDNLINGSPLLEEPRRYSGYFVGRLEKQGSLEWRSGWRTTEVGLALLQEANEKAGIDVEGEGE